MNCIIYARSATDENDHSILSQIKKAKEEVKKNHGNLLEVFQDCGMSGFDQKRPGIRAMLRYCRDNSVDFVYVSDISRLSRDALLFSTLSQELLKAGTQIKSISQPMFYDLPEDYFMGSISSLVNSYYAHIRNQRRRAKK